MDEYLQILGYDFWENSVVITEGITRLTKCKFLDGKDLIILNSFGQHIPAILNENAVDKCEFENFENRICIADYVSYKKNHDDFYFLSLGLEFTKIIAKRLQKEFPERSFRLKLSFGKIEDTDICEYGNCNVSFYTIRDDAEHIYRIDDLNNFKNEGLLEIDIKN